MTVPHFEYEPIFQLNRNVTDASYFRHSTTPTMWFNFGVANCSREAANEEVRMHVRIPLNSNTRPSVIPNGRSTNDRSPCPVKPITVVFLYIDPTGLIT